MGTHSVPGRAGPGPPVGAAVPRLLHLGARAEYGKVDAAFADATAATGAYEPLTETAQDPEYGPAPAPVARVCALTYFFCTDTDVHLTPAGHEAIAEAVLAAAGY
ncbi:hypothetical protein AB0E59_17695 [Lentzea sp. NPDC034063]|uniref:hypothetical protein n=1 Tax=unclassified Lentzea TaxID=2643253 RepID=UPI00340A9ECB